MIEPEGHRLPTHVTHEKRRFIFSRASERGRDLR